MNHNVAQVGTHPEQHHDMENLAISVEDVMCEVNLDAKQLTALSEMTNVMWCLWQTC